MSHDLVAVQRDAALLDALAERSWVPDTDAEIDPVAGLLAALAADVDEDLADVVHPFAPAVIPVQRRHEERHATVLALPNAIPPAGRRHAARAAAALFVTAALLSVSGVAAAVSGDPLTPYKRVVDVVRVSYHQVVPRRVVVPKPGVAPPAAKAVRLRAERAVKQARSAVDTRASRAGDRRRFWERHLGHRTDWQRTGVDPQRFGRADRDGSGRDGRQRSGGGINQERDGQHRTSFGGAGPGGTESGGGYGGWDPYARWDGTGNDRR